jgi:hypothetical protein
MKKFITHFVETGPCTVNVNKVVKAWDNKFSISRYHDKYTLVRGKGERCAKITITSEQAKEIISKAKLLPIQDSFFRHGVTFRSKENIESELARLENIEQEKATELKVISGVVREYRTALMAQNSLI